VSHETALSVYEISDANPAQVHLTVPVRFGRLAGGIRLHHADLTREDVDQRDGYRVTAPLRTLLDVAQAPTSQELLDDAVTEAVERGLVTVEQVARLVGGASDRTSWRLTQALEQL
jgi:predicted transcriptional regulator of viral defense system